MKRVLLIIALMSAVACAQQPQSTAPIYQVNSKTVQGVGPGYWPTAGVGLVLAVAPGTVNCAGTPAFYAGGTITLTASATNYVYLSADDCSLGHATTGFSFGAVPIATVVTGASAITAITDVRTPFVIGPQCAKGDPGIDGIDGLNGTNGTTWWNGNGAPSTLQADGDYYLNNTNGDIYRQAAGSWGSPTGNIKGPAGQGVPVGGTTDQVLAKIDSTDFNTHWIDHGVGGAVSSFNGRTGAVVPVTNDYSFSQISGSASESQITNLVSDLAGKQASLGFTPENVANKGAASGYAPLDATTKLAHAYLPPLLSADIPNNAANTSGNAAGLSADIPESRVTNLVPDLAAKLGSADVGTEQPAAGVTNCSVFSGGHCVYGNAFLSNPKTATYQVLAADFAGCKQIPVASGTFTITLVASGSQPPAGQCLWIDNYGSGVVTVARSGQNINGGTSSLSLTAGTATFPTGAFLVSDGTNYFAHTFGLPATAVTPGSYTLASIAVDQQGRVTAASNGTSPGGGNFFSTAGTPTLAAASTTYWTGGGGSAATTINARLMWIAPAAGTLTKLFLNCNITAAGNTAVATVSLCTGGSTSACSTKAITCTLPTGQSTPFGCSDTSHSFAYSAGDGLAVGIVTGSGWSSVANTCGVVIY